VYRLVSGDRVLYLKFASAPDVAREAAALARVTEAGIPAPIVEALDRHGHIVGRPALLLRKAQGRPLEGHEPMVTEAGHWLARLHEIPMPSFGPFSSWPEAMEDRIGGLEALEGSGLVPVDLLRAAQEAVRSRAVHFAAVTSAALVHGDFHPRHVFATGRRVTAIIDWGDAGGGDPVNDLARFFMAGVTRDTAAGWAQLDRLLSGYGGPAPAPELILTYAAAHILWGMKGEWDSGAPWPPWWPDKTNALRAVLDEL
jgi:aminoglycoside phosphotransferase (APT) family kinase protein